MFPTSGNLKTATDCSKKIAIVLAGIAMLLVAGSAPAYATATGTVSGTGSGTGICSSRPFPATFSFNATSSAGTMSGAFAMSFGPGTTGTSGIITGGHIGRNDYKLTGLTTATCAMNGLSVPSSITGGCGTGVTITYKFDKLGTAGSFTGDVTCS